MSDDDLRKLAELRADMPLFAAQCLKIRDKSEQIIPLVLNRTQRAAHALLEKQKDEKGWVRALILKGRQPGISTYVAARYYHRASMRKGVNVYILAHEQPASDNLFNIVDRYQRNNPLSPHIGASNAKELVFDKLESSYAVATAGTKAGGRSRTTSLFHGSEVAFWANAVDHFAASVQGVPLLPGTEIILESTSAGAGGVFYDKWQEAEAGFGDYIAIFLPWWWSEGPEYRREPEPGFTLSNDADAGAMSEQEYADFFGISTPQMCWRRYKIHELGSATVFQREYPETPAAAWTDQAGNEPFISAMLVLRARKRHTPAVGPLIIGVDPASNGGDRFSVAARRGMCVMWVRHRSKINHLEGSAWIRALVDDLKPARVNIDAGNIGVDVITDLKSIGPKYADLVRGVNFGGTSQAKLARPKVPGPYNRRAEMWARLRDWLMAEEGARLPDDGALQTDITAPRLKPKLNNDYLLESKTDMKVRNMRSPDLADAVALTFAFNEFIEDYTEEQPSQSFGDLDNAAEPAYSSEIPSGPTSWMG